MKIIKICLFIAFFNLSFNEKVFAQLKALNNDSIAKLIQRPAPSLKKLFIHFDKTNYYEGEQAWFAAYNLESDPSFQKDSVVTIVLYDPYKQSVIRQHKFLMLNGFANGSFDLPDSLVSGNYVLRGFSHLNDKQLPVNEFIQPVRILYPAMKSSATPAHPSIPIVTDKVKQVALYPESGDLVEGISSIIGVEAKTKSKQPLSIHAALYAGDKFLDSVYTAEDGLGRFFLKPVTNTNYTLRSGGVTLCKLPDVKSKGAVIMMRKAIVNDTLKCTITANSGQPLYVVLHDFHRLFYAVPFETNAAGRVLKIALKDIPPGLAALTILSEHNVPLAKRVFFAHYNQIKDLGIATDQEIYGLRKKVTVHIKMDSVQADSAVVSLACVKNSRLDQRASTDIRSFYYLNSQFEDMTQGFDLQQKSGTAADELENILMIKGWRKYVASASGNETTISSLRQSTYPEVTGFVSSNGKGLKKPVSLLIVADSSIQTVRTATNGSFTLPASVLAASSGDVVKVKVNDKNDYNYQITINDPYQFAGYHLPRDTSAIIIGNPNQQFIGEEPAVGIKLRTVTVKARRTDQMFQTPASVSQNRNACGDYICAAGALNCPLEGHLWRTTAPINGHRYIRHVISNNRVVANEPIVYEGCALESKKNMFTLLPGVNYNKAFYPLDLDSTEPLYQSTLYWNPSIKVVKGRSTEISFVTGDLTGAFIIDVQGIGNTGVVGGQANFQIKK